MKLTCNIDTIQISLPLVSQMNQGGRQEQKQTDDNTRI